MKSRTDAAEENRAVADMIDWDGLTPPLAEDPAPMGEVNPPVPQIKPPKKPSAKGLVPAKIEVTTALIKVGDVEKTLPEIAAEQLSLFDIAPWKDDMRAIPNDLARTSLFTIRNKKVPREAFVGQSIYSYNPNVQLLFTGVELRAEDDELVWQQVLEYNKKVPIGGYVYFSYYQLCNDLGWPTNGRYYDRAEKCLLRLNSATIQFASAAGRLDSISMIKDFKVANRVAGGKPMCRLIVPEQMVYLFAGGNYTMFIWSAYRGLKPIARRLFDYFASHRTPYPLALDKFQLLCNSKTERPAKWTEQTKMACSELLKSGLVQEAWVQNGKVFGRRYRVKEKE